MGESRQYDTLNEGGEIQRVGVSYLGPNIRGQEISWLRCPNLCCDSFFATTTTAWARKRMAVYLLPEGASLCLLHHCPSSIHRDGRPSLFIMQFHLELMKNPNEHPFADDRSCHPVEGLKAYLITPKQELGCSQTSSSSSSPPGIDLIVINASIRLLLCLVGQRLESIFFFEIALPFTLGIMV